MRAIVVDEHREFKDTAICLRQAHQLRQACDIACQAGRFFGMTRLPFSCLMAFSQRSANRFRVEITLLRIDPCTKAQRLGHGVITKTMPTDELTMTAQKNEHTSHPQLNTGQDVVSSL